MSAMLSAPNFSRKASARTTATMDSEMTAAAGTAQESARSLKARAGSPVERSPVRRALAIVEIGFAAEAVADARRVVLAGEDLVLHLARAARREVEAHPELYAFYGVDGHDGGGEPGVELVAPVHVGAEARRATLGHDDELAAQGVAGVAGRVDLGLHTLRYLGVGATHLGLVGLARLQGRPLLGVGDGPYAVDRALHPDAELGEELLGDAASGYPGHRLARAGALEDVAQVVEGVLLHPRQVRVPGPGKGDRLRGLFGWLGGHAVAPVCVVVVADDHRDRRA